MEIIRKEDHQYKYLSFKHDLSTQYFLLCTFRKLYRNTQNSSKRRKGNSKVTR